MPVCEHCADCKFSSPNCKFFEVHESLQPSSRFSSSDQGSLTRFKLFADSKGTDLGSFAKMIELPPQPCAPLAQLDRASDYESEGREFESLRARHSLFVFLLTTCTKTFHASELSG
jgi:hypothetical protein